MGAVIWIGAALTLLGVAGVLGCIVAVARARRSGLEDAAMRAMLQRVVAWNLAALLTSALGLGAVVVGIILS